MLVAVGLKQLIFLFLQESAASMSSSESGSDVNDTEIRNTKRKFEKIAVTWP